MDGLRRVVKVLNLNGVEIRLCVGLGCTERLVEELGVREVFVAAAFYGETTTDFPRARDAVMVHVCREWYRLRDVGTIVLPKQERRKTQRRGKDEPTGAQLIRDALLKGWNRDKIIDHVKENLPGYRINPNHIAYYRHQLRKRGELR